MPAATQLAPRDFKRSALPATPWAKSPEPGFTHAPLPVCVYAQSSLTKLSAPSHPCAGSWVVLGVLWGGVVAPRDESLGPARPARAGELWVPLRCHRQHAVCWWSSPGGAWAGGEDLQALSTCSPAAWELTVKRGESGGKGLGPPPALPTAPLGCCDFIEAVYWPRESRAG